MNRTPLFPFFLRADWDAAMAAWTATSEDQPDFVIQASRLDALVRTVEQRTAPAPPPCCIEPRPSCRG